MLRRVTCAMWLFAVVLLLVPENTHAEPTLLALSQFATFIDNFVNATIINYFTFSCSAKETFNLATDMLDNYNITNTGYTGIEIDADCGVVVTTYDTPTVSNTFIDHGTAVVESYVTTNFPMFGNTQVIDRYNMIQDGQSLAVIESLYNKRNSSPTRDRRNASKRSMKKAVAVTCPTGKLTVGYDMTQLSNDQIKVCLNTICAAYSPRPGGETTWTGHPATQQSPFSDAYYTATAQNVPDLRCGQLLSALATNNNVQGYSGSTCDLFYTGQNGFLQNQCEFQTLAYSVEATLNYKALADSLKAIGAQADAVNATLFTTLQTLRDFKAQDDVEQQMMETFRQQLTVAASGFDRVQDEIQGLDKVNKVASFAIQANAANNDLTASTVVASNVQQQQTEADIRASITQTNDNVRAGYINQYQTQQAMYQSIKSQFALEGQQVLQTLGVALLKMDNRHTQNEIDIYLKFSNAFAQIDSVVTSVLNRVDRLENTQSLFSLQLDDINQAWGNITQLEVGEGNLRASYHGMIQELGDRGYTPLLVDYGRPPMNFDEWQVLLGRKNNVTYTNYVNPSNNVSAICPDVANGNWRAIENAEYINNAYADIVVPISLFNKYLKYGDPVQIKSNGYTLSTGSQCGSCTLCPTPFTRACMCVGCTPSTLTIMKASEVFSDTFFVSVNHTATVTTNVQYGDEVVFVDSQTRLLYIVNQTSSNANTNGAGCLIDYTNFWSNVYYEEDLPYNYTAATFIVLGLTPINTSFPYIDTADSLILVPKLSYLASPSQGLGFGNNLYTTTNTSYVCLEHGAPTVIDTTTTVTTTAATTTPTTATTTTPTTTKTTTTTAGNGTTTATTTTPTTTATTTTPTTTTPTTTKTTTATTTATTTPTTTATTTKTTTTKTTTATTTTKTTTTAHTTTPTTTTKTTTTRTSTPTTTTPTTTATTTATTTTTTPSPFTEVVFTIDNTFNTVLNKKRSDVPTRSVRAEMKENSRRRTGRPIAYVGNQMSSRRSVVGAVNGVSRSMNGLFKPSDISFDIVPSISDLVAQGSGSYNFSRNACPTGATIVIERVQYVTLVLVASLNGTLILQNGFHPEKRYQVGGFYTFNEFFNGTIGNGFFKVPKGLMITIVGTKVITKDQTTYAANGTTSFTIKIYGPGRDHIQETQLYTFAGLPDWMTNAPGSSVTLTVSVDDKNPEKYTLACIGSPGDDVCPPYHWTTDVDWHLEVPYLYPSPLPYGAVETNALIFFQYLQGKRVSYQTPVSNSFPNEDLMEPWLPSTGNWSDFVGVFTSNAMKIRPAGNDYTFEFVANIFPGCNFNNTFFGTSSLYYTGDVPASCGAEFPSGSTWYNNTVYGGNVYDYGNIQLFQNDLITESPIYQCIRQCYTIGTYELCHDEYSGVCSWFYDKTSSPAIMRCANPRQNEVVNYDAVDPTVACTNATLYPDIVSCISGGTDTSCVWSKDSNSCQFFDLTHSQLVNSVIPCVERMDIISGFGACVPGADYWPDSPIVGSDYCFYKQTASTIDCLPMNMTYATACYTPGVSCQFGTPQVGPYAYQSINTQFYAQTTFDRDSLYNVDENDVNSLTAFCALYNDYPLECALKTMNANATSLCGYLTNTCAPVCSTFSGNAEGCVNNTPYGNCLYINSTQTCTANIADTSSIPVCQLYSWNCANARTRCNIWYYDADNCAADTTCTWLYTTSETNTNFTNHCIEQTAVDLIGCKDANGVINSTCDVGNATNSAFMSAFLSGNCQVLDETSPNYIQLCTDLVDSVTSEHCVGIVQRGQINLCVGPGDPKIREYQTLFSIGGIAIYYNTNATIDSVITTITFTNVTYSSIMPLLRLPAQITSAGDLNSHGITTIPAGPEGYYTYPCLNVGYVVVGDLCCPPADVISVPDMQDATARVTQCRLDSTNASAPAFKNPMHPLNLYNSISAELCISDNLTALATPTDTSFTIIYGVKNFPAIPTNTSEDALCPGYWSANGTAQRDMLIGFMFIEEAYCNELYLCQRLGKDMCKINMVLDGVSVPMIRLDGKALALLSFFQTFSLAGTPIDMSFITLRESWLLGLKPNVFKNNVTTTFTDLLPKIGSIDLNSIFNSLNSLFGSPSNWLTTTGDKQSVKKSYTKNVMVDGRPVAQVNRATFGYVNSTFTIPIRVMKNRRETYTATIKMYLTNGTNRTLLSTIFPKNSLSKSSASNNLPNDQTFFIWANLFPGNVVIDMPFDAVCAARAPQSCCHKAGYVNTLSKTSTNITQSQVLMYNGAYDPECMDSPPMLYATPMDMRVYNDTGYDYCGDRFGQVYEDENTLATLINEKFLRRVNGVDDNNQTAYQWWLDEINNNSTNTTVLKYSLLKFGEFTRRAGCVNAPANFFDPSDSYAPVANGTVYIFDKYRLWWEDEKEQIADGKTVDEALDIVNTEMILPWANTRTSAQCGNCGDRYGTQCFFAPFVNLPASAGLSARNGFCDYTISHDIQGPTPEPLSIMTFATAGSSVVIQHTFEVHFTHASQLVATTTCPTTPIVVDCGDTTKPNSGCDFLVTNPNTFSNLYLAFSISGQNCNDNIVLSFAPQITTSVRRGTCDGNVTITVRSADNNTVCYSTTKDFATTYEFVNTVLGNNSFANGTFVNNSLALIDLQFQEDLGNLQTQFNNDTYHTLIALQTYFNSNKTDWREILTDGVTTIKTQIDLFNGTSLNFTNPISPLYPLYISIITLTNNSAHTAALLDAFNTLVTSISDTVNNNTVEVHGLLSALDAKVDTESITAANTSNIINHDLGKLADDVAKVNSTTFLEDAAINTFLHNAGFFGPDGTPGSQFIPYKWLEAIAIIAFIGMVAAVILSIVGLVFVVQLKNGAGAAARMGSSSKGGSVSQLL